MAKRAIAIAAHPDDIEFMMAGTLLRLKEIGYEIHYMNIADGSLGSEVYDADELARIRRDEAIAAAKMLGAVFHESVARDVEVFYDHDTLGKVIEVIREVAPEIVLTHGPYDYMEDHINAGKLATAAAFCRGMKNYRGVKAPIVSNDVAVYHSVPQSLKDQLNRPLIPDVYVDVTAQMALKREALNCHQSQKAWLDVSQCMDAYLENMKNGCAAIGKQSGFCEYAEGWIYHNPCGFCADDFNPLSAIAKPATK